MAADFLASLIRGLNDQAPHPLTSLEAAEILWLARRCPPSLRDGARQQHTTTRPQEFTPPSSRQGDEDSMQPMSEINPSDQQQSDPASSSDPYPFFPPAPTAAVDRLEANLLPAEILPGKNELAGCPPLLVAQSPLFNDRFGVLWLLQPLMRKVPSPHHHWLDENATVERYAEHRLLEPVLRPAMEPCLRVVVLLDAGLSMEVWRPLAEELTAILSSSQAFHTVSVVDLSANPDFNPAQGWSQEGCLLLLLSDAVGAQWWNGRMFDQLERWGRTLPVVLLNMLPIAWWDRTALGIAPRVSVSNTQAAACNAAYSIAPINSWQRLDASAGLALPVITVEEQDLAIWAAMAMGDSEVAISGVLLPEAATRQQRLAEFLVPTIAAPPADARARREAASRRLEEFQHDASAQALRLLTVMAAAPVLTLPILRLLMEAKVRDARTPLPLAEVLVSGLLRCEAAAQPHTTNPRLQLVLDPDVAGLLRERLSLGDTVDVIRAVSAVIERRWNQLHSGQSFEAVLTDPKRKLPAGMEGILHFATVTAALLERLPGAKYRAFAAALRQGAGLPAADPFPRDQFAFAEIEVNPAVLLRDFPEPAELIFLTTRIQPLPLQVVHFKTARLEAGKPVFSWGTAEGFAEPLLTQGAIRSGGEPCLTMLHIPAGSFLMGSPPEEEGRFDDEGPQHTVQLDAFFLANTPVTQAQWRAVAEWVPQADEDPWTLELDPEPVAKLQTARRFRGDQRPVLNVRWPEAVEFCRRLQVRTGNHYTLPSEAQWEYACRAGTTTPFHFGDTLSSELANYNGNYIYAAGVKGGNRGQTTDVAQFPANDWGLHDMHGNVWEWCADDWHGNYKGAPVDGTAWLDQPLSTQGSYAKISNNVRYKLLRGGSWYHDPRNCRSAYRYDHHFDSHVDNVGFRVCCSPQDLLLYS